MASLSKHESRFFVGVDQKGSVIRSGPRTGQPTPLPFALVRPSRDRRFKYQLRVSDNSKRALDFEHFKPQSLESRLNSIDPELKLSMGAFLIDCVLGLPQDLLHKGCLAKFLETAKPQPSSAELMGFLFSLASAFPRDEGPALYGRAAASAFFRSTFPEVYPHPARRQCEIRLKANSLFLERPYQKNIQTGTFRFWREIGESLKDEPCWFHLWPHNTEKNSDLPLIGEGYPSALWKLNIGKSRSEPEQLVSWLKSERFDFKAIDEDILMTKPDWADAAILAASLAQNGGFTPAAPSIEGAIFLPN